MLPDDDQDIDPSHPRYRSLKLRQRMVKAVRDGIAVPEGLIAHGRGEMFDYLLGEVTLPPALSAERAAAALLVASKRPTISVNGNLAALCPEEVVALGRAISAIIEVNLFHWSEERAIRIRKLLESEGATGVLAENPDATMKGLHHDRAKCHSEGIFSADTVLIPLEDGDRACALADLKKNVISIDLNPLSRTTLFASVSIVDEVTRALPNITRFAKEFAGDRASAERSFRSFNNAASLKEIYRLISARFDELAKN